MRNPLKKLKYLHQKIILVIAGLVLLKTLILPNPIDILILIGLILVVVGWYSDELH